VNEFAPDEFRFSLRRPTDGPVSLDDKLKTAVGDLGRLAADRLGDLPEKEFGGLMYEVMHNHGLESAEFFPAVYQALIGKDQGPRLVNFLHVVGRPLVTSLLSLY
jgi:lysyl-tRNA synthetase class 1